MTMAAGYVPTQLGDIKRYKAYLPQKALAYCTVRFLGELIGDGWLDDVIWHPDGRYNVRYRFGEIMECQIYCHCYRWRGIPLKVWMNAMHMDRKAFDRDDWEWIKEQRRLLGEGAFRSRRLSEEEFQKMKWERRERLSRENPTDSELNPDFRVRRMYEKRRVARLAECARAKADGLPPPPAKHGRRKRRAAAAAQETHAPEQTTAASGNRQTKPKTTRSSGGLLDV